MRLQGPSTPGPPRAFAGAWGAAALRPYLAPPHTLSPAPLPTFPAPGSSVLQSVSPFLW